MKPKVLMSDASNFSVHQAINPYYKDGSLDQAQAIAEHDKIVKLYKSIGVEVVDVQSPAESQDGVYTANWALVRYKKAVMARLPGVRKAEEEVAEHYLQALGYETIKVPDEWLFSGQGDALPCGDLLFCGKSYRSDERAQQFAAETLGFERVQLETIPELDVNGVPALNTVTDLPDSFFYDIDLAVAVVRQPTVSDEAIVAYCPEALTPESQAKMRGLMGIDLIEVSLDEAVDGFACNLFSTGKDVIMSAHAPQLKTEIQKRGLHVHTPEVTELIKGGGFIRCVSLSLVY